MIETRSDDTRYKTVFTNAKQKGFSDVPAEKGGSESGFRPHELLEAAVGCCVNIWVRTYADNHNIPLSGVSTKVLINRAKPGETVFEYSVDLDGSLDEEQRQKLIEVASTCPVHQTLSRKISFKQM
jgi:putative redox protein